jgi:hypothetical protein
MDDLLSKGGASFGVISAAKQLILRAIRFVMEVMSGEGGMVLISCTILPLLQTGTHESSKML